MTAATGTLKSSVGFDAKGADETSADCWKPSVGSIDSSCSEHLVCLACEGFEPRLKWCTAMQSFLNWQKTAADEAQREGANGAQRFLCQR